MRVQKLKSFCFQDWNQNRRCKSNRIEAILIEVVSGDTILSYLHEKLLCVMP